MDELTSTIATAVSQDLTLSMALMALGIKCGQEVRVTAEGPDEEAAADGIKAFLEANL